MATQEQRVFSLLKDEPLLSQQDLADRLGISRNAAAGHISRLMRKGLITGKGYVFPSQNEWLVIGGCNLDVQGKAFSAIEGADSYPGTVVETAGGVGRNMAENLARLGLPTRLISVVGQDRSGDWLVSHCRDAGIEVDSMFRLSGFPTSRYLSIVDSEGALQAAIADMTIIDQLDAALLAPTLGYRSQAAGLLLDSNLTASALAEVFRPETTPPCYVDCVSQAKAVKLLPWLHRIHTLKLNRAEAFALLGPTQSYDDIISRLLALGVSQVLLSLGAEGVAYGDANGILHQGPLAATIISDNGAGDALLSGFVVAESRLLTGLERLSFAQICAAITLGYSGANNPELSLKKVSTWLS